jgi:hypothetical protein
MCYGAQSAPQQSLGRQQRDVMAGGAIDLREVARPEILDPRGVEGSIPGLRSSSNVPMGTEGEAAQPPMRRNPGQPVSVAGSWQVLWRIVLRLAPLKPRKTALTGK